MPTPDPSAIRSFTTARAFEAWMKKHHDKATEIYLRIFKKDSGVKSVSVAEALDVALCWGWIDGVRKSFDAQSYLQRYSPRRPKSIWSQINRDNIARLIEAGRMTEHGLAQVDAAKADGRWDAAYAASSQTTTPPDLMRAIEVDAKALATYRTLSKQNLFALAFRVSTMKTEAGRTKKIATLVAMLARGETIHPNKRPK